MKKNMIRLLIPFIILFTACSKTDSCESLQTNNNTTPVDGLSSTTSEAGDKSRPDWIGEWTTAIDMMSPNYMSLRANGGANNVKANFYNPASEGGPFMVLTGYIIPSNNRLALLKKKIGNTWYKANGRITSISPRKARIVIEKTNDPNGNTGWVVSHFTPNFTATGYTLLPYIDMQRQP